MGGRHLGSTPVLGGDVAGLAGRLAASPLDRPVARALWQALRAGRTVSAGRPGRTGQTPPASVGR